MTSPVWISFVLDLGILESVLSGCLPLAEQWTSEVVIKPQPNDASDALYFKGAVSGIF